MWLARVLCPKRSDLLKPAVKNGGKDKSKSKGEGKSTRNSVVPCIVQAGKEVLHTYHLPKGALSNVLMDLVADLLGVPVNEIAFMDLEKGCMLIPGLSITTSLHVGVGAPTKGG